MWESAFFCIASLCRHHASISASNAASELDADTLFRSVGGSQFTPDRVIAVAVAGSAAMTCAPTATGQTAPIQSQTNDRSMAVISRQYRDSVGILAYRQYSRKSPRSPRRSAQNRSVSVATCSAASGRWQLNDEANVTTDLPVVNPRALELIDRHRPVSPCRISNQHVVPHDTTKDYKMIVA